MSISPHDTPTGETRLTEVLAEGSRQLWGAGTTVFHPPTTGETVAGIRSGHHVGMKQAFESFLNKDTRTAQYLSLFVDDLFRKGIKGMSNIGVQDQ